MRNCQKWSGRLSNEQMIRVQRKLKFKVGNLKNNENVTSHHFTYITKEKKISAPPLAIVPESKNSW